jgi:hypothetical protein
MTITTFYSILVYFFDMLVSLFDYCRDISYNQFIFFKLKLIEYYFLLLVLKFVQFQIEIADRGVVSTIDMILYYIL